MTSPIAIACSLALLLAASGAARAEDPLGSYMARLGPDDHFNSSGERLSTAAAVIRQDRANFHAFQLRDREDQTDPFFRSKENRARLERMLSRGGASKATLRAIVDGHPLIEVTIYRDMVEVLLLD